LFSCLDHWWHDNVRQHLAYKIKPPVRLKKQISVQPFAHVIFICGLDYRLLATIILQFVQRLCGVLHRDLCLKLSFYNCVFTQPITWVYLLIMLGIFIFIVFACIFLITKRLIWRSKSQSLESKHVVVSRISYCFYAFVSVYIISSSSVYHVHLPFLNFEVYRKMHRQTCTYLLDNSVVLLKFWGDINKDQKECFRRAAQFIIKAMCTE